MKYPSSAEVSASETRIDERRTCRFDRREEAKKAWLKEKERKKEKNQLTSYWPADSCRSPFPQSKLWDINRVPLSVDCPKRSECNCLQRLRFRPCRPCICTGDTSCNRQASFTRAKCRRKLRKCAARSVISPSIFISPCFSLARY